MIDDVDELMRKVNNPMPQAQQPEQQDTDTQEDDNAYYRVK
jgi:hypothetical protein